MDEVVLVDAGGSNLGSVCFALQRLGATPVVTRDAARIRAARRVILPGVGAAGEGMRCLREAGLVEVIRALRQPVLGICLGMQLLFDHSAEDDTATLAVIPGRVTRIAPAVGCRVPHMGWNRLIEVAAHPLLTGVAAGDFAYFVHSYAAPAGPATIAGVEHAGHWSAAVARGNFCGVQFHPERSAACGARILHNFIDS